MGLLSIARYWLDHASPFHFFMRRALYSIDRIARPPEMQWARIVMYKELSAFLEKLDTESLDALEISPGEYWQQFKFKSYTSIGYPEIDICENRLDADFDIVVADQVFEHLLWPRRAACNVYSMLRPGGRFIVTAPFLIRVHDDPIDCSRWTELGLKHLLADSGFSLDRIHTGAWGNRACVKANLASHGWAVMSSWRSLKNEPEFPVTVWAIAQK